MAGRALFSLDQDAFAGKCILRNLGKRVKSQIWIAVSVYVLVAIIRQRLNLTRSLYEMLQILSLNLFEKTSLDVALSRIPVAAESPHDSNQLILF